MLVGEMLSIRCLPAGLTHTATVLSREGRILELDLSAEATDCIVGAALEMIGDDSIYLGVIERRKPERVWINVEHLIDRKTLSRIQAAWNTAGQ